MPTRNDRTFKWCSSQIFDLFTYYSHQAPCRQRKDIAVGSGGLSQRNIPLL